MDTGVRVVRAYLRCHRCINHSRPTVMKILGRGRDATSSNSLNRTAGARQNMLLSWLREERTTTNTHSVLAHRQLQCLALAESTLLTVRNARRRDRMANWLTPREGHWTLFVPWCPPARQGTAFLHQRDHRSAPTDMAERCSHEPFRGNLTDTACKQACHSVQAMREASQSVVLGGRFV